MKPFPVGGPREPVYNYLLSKGFIMSRHSDKFFTRADGQEVHLYGAGSMVRVYGADGKLLKDAQLAEAL